MSKLVSGKAVKRLRRGGPRMFRSFDEFRAHFFPEEWKRERKKAEIAKILKPGMGEKEMERAAGEAR